MGAETQKMDFYSLFYAITICVGRNKYEVCTLKEDK